MLAQMGFIKDTRCMDCGHQFETYCGPGLLVEAHHCDTCGRTRSFLIERVRESQKAAGCYEEEDHTCECGGRFGIDNPRRCPACRSVNVRFGDSSGHFS